MFELKNISKQFHGEYALRNVSLSIGRGLHFVTGPSGSGKTTLLNIMTGMERDFEGQAFYCGQDLRALTARERRGYYNSVFGFVWQDFNLLEDWTVLENVMLPQLLKERPSEKKAMGILRELGVGGLARQRAGKLSGGQKQRVAIARELAKDPQVILADEPTSALDAESARRVMDILRAIAKKRTVIVVTHDASLIRKGDQVYELDKGELTNPPEWGEAGRSPKISAVPGRLSLGNAARSAWSGIRCRVGRAAASLTCLAVSAALLTTAASGILPNSGAEAFRQLFDTYGEGILDISVASSFISAGGTDRQVRDEPSADVEQDISGLYERYRDDPRVSHIAFLQAYNDISITVDGQTYAMEQSNSVPYADRLTAGAMPMGDGFEIVIPQSLADRLGRPAEELLGKTVDFSGSVYNWDSGEPVLRPVSVRAAVVGVMDTTVRYDYGGQVLSYTVDDAFFFSKSALDEMRAQAGIARRESNFVIRAKTPADLIDLKDELNAEGIVPLGRFELVEDLVRLDRQTARQSGSAAVVIAVLALVLTLSAALLTAVSRRREYAILQASGYGTAQRLWIAALEYLLLGGGAAVLLLCASPLLAAPLWAGPLLAFLTAALGWGVTAAISAGVKAETVLKAGER